MAPGLRRISTDRLGMSPPSLTLLPVRTQVRLFVPLKFLETPSTRSSHRRLVSALDSVALLTVSSCPTSSKMMARSLSIRHAVRLFLISASSFTQVRKWAPTVSSSSLARNVLPDPLFSASRTNSGDRNSAYGSRKLVSSIAKALALSARRGPGKVVQQLIEEELLGRGHLAAAGASRDRRRSAGPASRSSQVDGSTPWTSSRVRSGRSTGTLVMPASTGR